MAILQKIQPHLWFDNRAEEAARFYTSVFNDSAMGPITRYGTEGFEYHHMPEGSVMTVEFRIEGQHFIALNGGPVFRFNEAVSFVIMCDSQEETDYYWNRLTGDGGEEGMCGWLTDKFGLSWQVVPAEFTGMMRDPDPEKVRRVTHAMFQMKKLDIEALRAAFNNTSINHKK